MELFFQLLLHSKAHISMSCYISIAMYLNRLKKLFIFVRYVNERTRDIGKLCDVLWVNIFPSSSFSISPKSFHNQFICYAFFFFFLCFLSFTKFKAFILCTSQIYCLSFYSLFYFPRSDPYIERKEPSLKGWSRRKVEHII